MKRGITIPRMLALALAGALLSCLIAVPSALGGRAGARASAAPRLTTGIGNSTAGMFRNPLFKQLHLQTVRYIAPYDAMRHGYSLMLATEFIRAAEAQHEQVLVAFYHSEYSPTVLPSISAYQADVEKFIKHFPYVRLYQSWDEANRGSEPHLWTSPSAVSAALYYQALLRVCQGCTVIGLDVLDQADINPTLWYISEFKREVGRLHVPMPSIWGLHNYSDVNRLQSWRTRDLVHALGGQVWLTETGGIVKLGNAWPNVHGSGLRRAARVLKYTFDVAYEFPQIKRLYIYEWSGAGPDARFDAGLTNVRGQPREGYVVVCRELHAKRCNVRTVNN